MAPKIKQTARRQGPATRASTSSARQPPPAQNQSFFDSCFRDTRARERFTTIYARMPIQQCRVIDFPFLRSINYPYLQTFETFGWTKILSLNVPVRENLVRAFFSNASLVVDDHDNVIAIRSYLLGRDLMVNRASLASAFGFPNEGAINEGSGPVALRTLHNKASLLPPVDRLLHLILSHVLRPYGTKHTVLSDPDYWWLHMIQSGTRPNLAYFIFADLVLCVRGCHSLLHGMALSYYFETQGLDLSCDPGIMVTSYRYIGRKSMGLAGYEIQGGEFVPKARRQPPLEQPDAPAPDDIDELEHDEPLPPPPPPAPMDIPTMFTSIMNRFDTWEGRFSNIDARLSALEQSHRALTEQFHAYTAPVPRPRSPTPPPTEDPPTDNV